jgi:hypothetical protein
MGNGKSPRGRPHCFELGGVRLPLRGMVFARRSAGGYKRSSFTTRVQLAPGIICRRVR